MRLQARQTPKAATATASRAQVTDLVSGLLGGPPGVELTSSCTHALEAATTILGVGPGDEVIVPAFTFPSTANAALLRGARLRFADSDPLTGNLDPRSVEARIGPTTRAVICTHYAGIACDMAALVKLCEQHDLVLIEDAAHALFGCWHGQPLGRIGAVGALSFHHTKNISSGEGGALVINDPDLLTAAHHALDKGTNRVEFEDGQVSSYEWVGPGSSWRMPELAVDLLARQLAVRDEIQAARRHAWNRYRDELQDWARSHGAQLPHLPPGVEHPAHLFWVLLPDGASRNDFVAHCSQRGVQTARHFGSLPTTRYGAQIRHPADDCPVAERFGTQLVRLPLHHELDDSAVERVLEAVTSYEG